MSVRVKKTREGGGRRSWTRREELRGVSPPRKITPLFAYRNLEEPIVFPDVDQ